jgi:hypothetical protein
MKTLKEIQENARKTFDDVAKEYTTRTNNSPNTFLKRRTGTLYKSIRVLKTFEDASNVKFDLTSVRYGVFQNLGFTHWRSKKFIIRPFGTEASKDKRVVNAFKEIQDKMVEVAVMDLLKEQLGKYGLGPKISPNSSTKRYSY